MVLEEKVDVGADADEVEAVVDLVEAKDSYEVLGRPFSVPRERGVLGYRRSVIDYPRTGGGVIDVDDLGGILGVMTDKSIVVVAGDSADELRLGGGEVCVSLEFCGVEKGIWEVR